MNASVVVPPPRSFLRSWSFAILVGILLLAAGLRLTGLSQQPLWLDELYTIRTLYGHRAPLPLKEGVVQPIPQVTRPIEIQPAPAIWTALKVDSHPPLYYLLFRAWRNVFGDSVFTFRVFSVVLSLGAIVGLFVAARIAFGTRTALWAAAVMAVMSVDVRYGREIRGYECVIFFSTWTLAVFLYIDRFGFTFKRGVVLTTLVAAMALTHYYFIGAAIAMAAYALFFMRGQERVGVIRSFTVAAAVFLILWGPGVLSQRAHGNEFGHWLMEPESHHLKKTFQRLATSIGGLLVMVPRRWEKWTVVAGLLLILPLLRVRRDRGLMVAWIWVIAVVGFLLLMDVVVSSQMLEQQRYAILAGPCLAILAAASFRHLQKPYADLLPAAVVLVCLATVGWTIKSDFMRYAESHETYARYLDAHVKDGDILVFVGEPDDRLAQALVMIYAHFSQHPVDRVVLSLDQPGRAALEGMAGHQRIWLIHHDRKEFTPFTLPGYDRVNVPNPRGKTPHSQRFEYLCEIHLLQQSSAMEPQPK